MGLGLGGLGFGTGLDNNSKGEKPIPLKDALFLPEWDASSRTAAMLRRQAKKFGLNLKLDQVTSGKGNCFFVAIIQQLRRPEIYSTVSGRLQQMADTWDHLALRKAVCSFAKSSTEVAARRELLLFAMHKVKPLDIYWGPDHMMKSTVWVDAAAVQVSAWFLGMDLLILSDTSNHQSPQTRIPSSFDDIIDVSKKEIMLGAKTDKHYQSLLPKNIVSVSGSQSSQYRTTPREHRRKPAKAAEASNLPRSPFKIQQKPLKPNTKQKSEAAWSKPSLVVSYSLSSLSSSTRATLAQKQESENKKKPTDIIKETAPSLKRKRQSDDETVEENKMEKIEYVTYHRGHGAQGVPKLVIRRIKSHGQK